MLGNAEELPFNNDSFDVYTIAFGIRNVTHIDQVSVNINGSNKKSTAGSDQSPSSSVACFLQFPDTYPWHSDGASVFLVFPTMCYEEVYYFLSQRFHLAIRASLAK